MRWNAFGTPASISPPPAPSVRPAPRDAVTAARSWLGAHAAVFGLSAAQVSGLELVGSQKLAGSGARAVLFRQDLGENPPALGSMVTVGVGGGAIQYVSSSLVRTTGQAPAPSLSATAAWLKAAANIGRTSPALGARHGHPGRSGWTRFKVAGFAQEQQVRLRSLALADGTVRPVFEANVVDAQGGSASAYTLLVDAVSGKVLVRQNKVDQSSDAFQFQGAVTATACGPKHTLRAHRRQHAGPSSPPPPQASPPTTSWSRSSARPAQVLATSDTADQPGGRDLHRRLASRPGIYSMQVCPFADPTVPFVAPGTYAGGVTTSDSGAPTTPTLGQPKWRYFTANPTLDWSAATTPANSVIGCWTNAAGCTTPTGRLPQRRRRRARGTSWPRPARPTFTTVGNNANTHEAWANPLAPGGTGAGAGLPHP